jgi:hypothetical protein
MNRVLEKRGAELLGKHIAWSEDGIEIPAVGDSLDEVLAEINRQNLKDDQFFIDRIPLPDEVQIGGGGFTIEDVDSERKSE